MKKRMMAICCLVVMIISVLTGCAEKDLYEEAMNKANHAKNMEATATMDLSMNMKMNGQEQAMDMKMTMDMTVFEDPFKMKMSADVSMLGQSTKMNSYVAKEGDKYMTYTQVAGQWMKTALCDADDMETAKKNANSLNAAGFMLEKKTMTEGEEVSENGKTYKTFTGKMTKEMMKKSMESSISGLSSAGLNEETLNKIIDKMADVSYTMWLDTEEQTLYRVKFSMKDMMNSLMDIVMKEQLEKAAGSSSAEVKKALKDVKIDVTKCDMDLIYKNYDNAQDFEVPAEALKAKETETIQK